MTLKTKLKRALGWLLVAHAFPTITMLTCPVQYGNTIFESYVIGWMVNLMFLSIIGFLWLVTWCFKD